jgi:predicted secreted protein
MPSRRTRRGTPLSVAFGPGGVRLIAGTVALAVALTGCGGAESSSSSTTTVPGTVSAAAPVTVPAYCDPAVPISVALGQQFALALTLESNAASGLSWQTVTPPNPAILLSIGTEFPGPGRTVEGGSCQGETQVMRYGGRALGTTTITLRYGRPGAAAATDPTATFSVTVIDPNAPPTTAPPTTVTTAAAATTTRPKSTTTTRPTTTTTKAHTTPTT